MKKYIYLVVLVALCSSCENSLIAGIFRSTSARANTRFAQSMEYNETHGYASIATNDEYIIYVCSDTHVTDSSRSFTRFVMDYKSDPNCPFALHLGDMIHDKDHFPLFFSQAAAQPQGYIPGSDTIFYSLGNHDIYYAQWEAYRRYQPSTTYIFSTHNPSGKPLDLFICMDTAEGTLGSDALAWLRELLGKAKNEGWRHIIVFTHTNLFAHNSSLDFNANLNLEETYELTYLFQQAGVDVVLAGHCHYRGKTEYGGVTYLTLDALQDKNEDSSYLKLSLSQHINEDWVDVKDVSETKI